MYKNNNNIHNKKNDNNFIYLNRISHCNNNCDRYNNNIRI